MRRSIRGFLAFAGGLTLAACAAHAPVAASGTPGGSVGAAAATTSPAGSGAAAATAGATKSAKAKLPPGYQLVVKKGTEYYCHYEPVAGSRTLRDEICLTKEQMAATQKNSDEFMQQVGELPVNTQGMNPSGRGR